MHVISHLPITEFFSSHLQSSIHPSVVVSSLAVIAFIVIASNLALHAYLARLLTR